MWSRPQRRIPTETTVSSIERTRQKPMKMSSLTLYCEHCGAANTAEDTKCFACQEPLQVSEPASFVQAPALPLPTPSPPTTSEQLLPGALLHHRYEVVSEVGQGG